MRNCLMLLIVPCGFSGPFPGTGKIAESPSMSLWLLESLRKQKLFRKIFLFEFKTYLIIFVTAAFLRSLFMLRALG